MQIHRIKIANFKSIVDINIDNISNFSIFAGANGVGKSNIFEALEFVKAVIDTGAVNAINKYGGYDNIHSKKLRKQKARKFLFEIKITINENLYFYKLELEHIDTNPKINEIFEVNNKNIIQSTNDKITINKQEVSLNISRENTLLILIINESIEFMQFIKSIQRYTIDPNLAREADDISSDNKLYKNASNITTVLSNIEKNHPQAVDEIIDIMQLLIPNLETIKIQKEKLNNKIVSIFKEATYKETFPARLVSDGTIYALAILAIIYSNTNGIIMIEEPERGLHPKAIGEIVTFFRDKAKIFPIFINTHNEAILKKAKPKEVFIVSKKNGQTELFNVYEKFPNYDYSTMDINTMLLSNMFGDGLPW